MGATSRKCGRLRSRLSRRGSWHGKMRRCWAFWDRACRLAVIVKRSDWCGSFARCERGVRECGTAAEILWRKRSDPLWRAPEAVVRGADVVVTVTASPTPVIQNEWVSDGTHVIGVGSCVPWQRELDPALVARARLVVDSRAAALKEAGDVVMGIDEGRWTAEHIAAELGELPSRQNDREITVFKSLGLAVEDIFAAHMVLTHAA